MDRWLDCPRSQRRSADARRAGIGRAATATRSRSSPARRWCSPRSTRPGVVRHVWMTAASDDPYHLRTATLRACWDGAATPCIETPLGDFFGLGHARTVDFWSLPLQMSPQDGKGLQLLVPDAVRLGPDRGHERGREPLTLYYYIDYELGAPDEPGAGRFHARWHRENPTDGIDRAGRTNDDYLFGGVNLDGAGNYVILEATGRGPLRRVPSRHRQSKWGRTRHVRLVRRGRRHDLRGRRGVPAIAPRHRDRGLLRHGVVPDGGVLSAISRHHPAGRPELVGRDLPLSLSHRGPGPVPRVDPRDHRARPRESAVGRPIKHGVLVSASSPTDRSRRSCRSPNGSQLPDRPITRRPPGSAIVSGAWPGRRARRWAAEGCSDPAIA